MTLWEGLISVWRQALLENAYLMEIEGKHFPGRQLGTPRIPLGTRIRFVHPL